VSGFPELGELNNTVYKSEFWGFNVGDVQVEVFWVVTPCSVMADVVTLHGVTTQKTPSSRIQVLFLRHENFFVDFILNI
jgi:hypothetical protein